MTDFAATIAEPYSTEGAAIDLGRGVQNGELAPDAVVRVPLRMMNRHGIRAEAESAHEKLAARMEEEDEAELTEPKAPRRRQPGPQTGGADTLTGFLTSREAKRCRRR
jgi:hypothetical protein